LGELLIIDMGEFERDFRGKGFGEESIKRIKILQELAYMRHEEIKLKKKQ